jgi:hypothetical protein
MLNDEIKNIKEDKKALQNFGLTIGAVLLLIGIILYFTGKTSFIYFAGSGILLVLLGVTFPAALKPLNKIWMTLALILGWFMSRVILIILFYLIITPMAFFLKIIGKDFLKLRTDKNIESYWEKRDKQSNELPDYERQF